MQSSSQDKGATLTAREAAAELGITRASLYAYVSRGLIRAEAGQGRVKAYNAADVRALRRRTAGGPSPESEAAQPLLNSAITLIDRGQLYYRGRDAVRLAAAASLETVAGILWQSDDAALFAAPPPVALEMPGLPGPGRAIALLAAAGATDERAHNLSPRGVARSGAQILHLVAQGLLPGFDDTQGAMHERLADLWRVPQAAAVIRAALVLSADHELNASAYAARVVAATRATPYQAVIAGLAALQGPRHGGQTAQVAALFREADHAGSAEQAVLGRLSRGEALPGFGHPLYPAGDPRASALLARLPADGRAATQQARDFAAAVNDLADLKPSIDFALVALQRAWQLPERAAFALFAIGRTVGWIAHAQEQYADARLIRPRARYVGEAPNPGKYE